LAHASIKQAYELAEPSTISEMQGALLRDVGFHSFPDTAEELVADLVERLQGIIEDELREKGVLAAYSASSH